VPKVTVVDTVGAGDSFFGAVLAQWNARGLGRAELSDSRAVVAAVEFGVAISGITCGRTGADPPRIDELTPGLQAKLSRPQGA
jgi:fructokinase